MSWIVVLAQNGRKAGTVWRFSKPSVSIGRGPNNDVCLTGDPTVSDTHAFFILKEGKWYLEDCGSTNGTFVLTSGRPSRVNGRTPILRSAQILLGNAVVSVDIQPPSDAPGESAVVNTMILPPLPGSITANPVAMEARFAGPSSETKSLLLRVTHERGELRYEFLSSRGLGHRYSTPYSQQDVSTLYRRFREELVLLDASEGSLRKLHERRAQEAMTNFGRVLSDLVLPRRVRRKLEGAQSTRLYILHDASLTEWPIELADVGGVPLCRRFSVGRGVIADHHSTDHSVDSSHRASDRARVLILCNPTCDLPEAERETTLLVERLSKLPSRPELEMVTGERVDRFETLARLNSTDVLYYMGHAVYDESSPQRSGWLLSGGARITSEDLARLTRPPLLVIANACETGREPARETGEVDLRYGLAAGTLLSGVPNYLGTAWPVPEASSAVFGAYVLEACLSGEEIGTAVREARRKLAAGGDPAGHAWGAYILFGEPRNRVTLG